VALAPGRYVSRHQRLKRPLSSSLRLRKQLRNRKLRLVRRAARLAMGEMFRADVRLVPPPWMLNELYGLETYRPQDLVKIAGSV
jgi:hypothetical protein